MTDPETQDRIAAVREYARALEAWIAELVGRRVENELPYERMKRQAYERRQK